MVLKNRILRVPMRARLTNKELLSPNIFVSPTMMQQSHVLLPKTVGRYVTFFFLKGMGAVCLCLEGPLCSPYQSYWETLGSA